MGKKKVTARQTGQDDRPTPPDQLPPDKLAIYKRLRAQGQWNPELRDQMIKEARAAGLDREAAQAWVYAELDRMHPPAKSVTTDETVQPAEATEVAAEGEDGEPGNGRTPLPRPELPLRPPSRESGRVVGLDAIPPAWPALPASAALNAEVSWVQANRLLIVSEAGNAVRVDLSRAGEPAPSRSALAWLETSVRNYAKYTDVAARCLAGGTDEGEDVRRERTSLAEIERLLGSMGGTV